jgi:hypothetical protein
MHRLWPGVFIQPGQSAQQQRGDRQTRTALSDLRRDRLNPIRIKNGLQPIVPLPGAYEPQAEDVR